MVINSAIQKTTKPRKGGVFLFFFFLFSFVISCSPAQPTSPTQIVTINYSPFLEAQMPEAYACAHDLSIVLKITNQEPEIRFQIGEPDASLGGAYQIGEEEIVIAANAQNALPTLSLTETQNLFASGEHVWVYAEGEQIQKLFDQFVMEGRSVSSFAKIAPNPNIMMRMLEENPNAVGLIPKSWLNTNLKEIYSLGVFPVLALTPTEPQGAVKSLIGCLQGF